MALRLPFLVFHFMLYKLEYATILKFGQSLVTNLLQLKATNRLNIFLLDMNFNKFTIGLHFLLISSMLAKFLKIQRSITMSSIKYLNFKFL